MLLFLKKEKNINILPILIIVNDKFQRKLSYIVLIVLFIISHGGFWNKVNR